MCSLARSDGTKRVILGFDLPPQMEDDNLPSINPDTELSHIDEKIESVLGHFHKDLEGGVKKEKLGAVFGGYGSFLPPCSQPSPPCSHPRSASRDQTIIAPSSPEKLKMEVSHGEKLGNSHSDSELLVTKANDPRLKPWKKVIGGVKKSKFPGRSRKKWSKRGESSLSDNPDFIFFQNKLKGLEEGMKKEAQAREEERRKEAEDRAYQKSLFDWQSKLLTDMAHKFEMSVPALPPCPSYESYPDPPQSFHSDDGFDLFDDDIDLS